MKRLLLHVPVGFINGLLFHVDPFLAMLFGAGFITYELSQGNCPWRDIKGWLWGLGILGMLYLFCPRNVVNILSYILDFGL